MPSALAGVPIAVAAMASAGPIAVLSLASVADCSAALMSITKGAAAPATTASMQFWISVTSLATVGLANRVTSHAPGLAGADVAP